MIKEAISKLVEKVDLTEYEAESAMREIMEGEATPAQIASYITALRMKGETVDEITGSAKVMREKAIRIRVDDPSVVDTCGTGGDRLHTFNISTTVAFVVAGTGITVAKHGNKSVSSKSGSADLLKALGVKLDIPPSKVEDCVNEIGIGFLFAPMFHGAMKHALAPRQEIGIRSIFNILGPLTNPAGASIQVLGVYAEELTDLLARVLINLGSRHCFVVHGMDGLDEITITERTKISEGCDGRVSGYFVDPTNFKLATGRIKDLIGGDAGDNARITEDILNGSKGVKRDIVLLNSAPAIMACNKTKSWEDAMAIAVESIDSGAALEKLKSLRAFTNR